MRGTEGRTESTIRRGRFSSGGGLRLAAVGFLLITPPARAGDGDGDGPDLTPPAGMPATAPAPVPVPVPAPSPNPSRAIPTTRGPAVLALPGLTSTPAPAPAPPPTAPPSTSPSDGPELDAPAGMQRAPNPILTPVPNANANPNRAPRPLVLESTPTGEPIPAPRRSTTIPPSDPPPPQVRRPRLFGLLPAQPIATPTPAPSPSPARSSSSASGRPGRSSVGDPTTADPAVESALKRRIETQALLAVGERARSVDVRVVGRDVTIRARGVRFYQKRAVRKSLEAVPALSGLRSTIEVVD